MTRIRIFRCVNARHSSIVKIVPKGLMEKTGLNTQICTESAASAGKLTSPVYSLARRNLTVHEIDYAGKTARQQKREDCAQYDLLVGMDQAKMRNMHRTCGGSFAKKMHLLMIIQSTPAVWLIRSMQTILRRDVLAGCHGLPGQYKGI